MASKRAISVERYENMGEAALVQKIMTREALVARLEDGGANPAYLAQIHALDFERLQNNGDWGLG